MGKPVSSWETLSRNARGLPVRVMSAIVFSTRYLRASGWR
jgi:hypothetical protein